MYLPPHQADPMFAALKETISRTVQPGDEVSVVSWNRHEMRHDEFTGDLPGALASIDRVAEQTKDAERPRSSSSARRLPRFAASRRR